jgi:hypothetical protein
MEIFKSGDKGSCGLCVRVLEHTFCGGVDPIKDEVNGT